MCSTAALVPEQRPLPDYLIPLGRTFGLPMNGAVSNLSSSPEAIRMLGRELRNGGYDVVHVHEPNAPVVELVRRRGRAPADGRHLPHLLDQLAHQHVRGERGRRCGASTPS